MEIREGQYPYLLRTKVAPTDLRFRGGGINGDPGWDQIPLLRFCEIKRIYFIGKHRVGKLPSGWVDIMLWCRSKSKRSF